MIIFLCGRPGSGKNTIGRQLAHTIGTHFMDADSLYTPDDQSRIRSSQFTWEDSRVFFERLKHDLARRMGERMCVISGQGLFLEAYRRELKEAFGNRIFLVHLCVSHEQALERLTHRSVEGEPHFYSIEQYRQEAHEYEEEGIFDMTIDNSGKPEDAQETILAGLAYFLRETAQQSNEER